MTGEVATPTGAGGLNHPPSPADRLALAFLLAYREGNTRDAYRRDLADWWGWCAGRSAPATNRARPAAPGSGPGRPRRGG
jgi:hypothetical protein